MKIPNIVELILNNNTQKSHFIKLGIYFGSFDPPHNGHLEVIDKMLELELCDYVLVSAVRKTKNKPNLSDHFHRLIMVSNMINSYQTEKNITNKIFYVENDLNETIDFLRTNNIFHLIGIAGSDFYIRFFEKGIRVSLKFHEWIITPRGDFAISSDNDIISNVKKLNLRITLLDKSIFNKQQYLSSSYIKKFDKYNELCEQNQEYILEHKLYENYKF